MSLNLSLYFPCQLIIHHLSVQQEHLPMPLVQWHREIKNISLMFWRSRGKIDFIFHKTSQSVFISGADSAILFSTIENIWTPHCSRSNNVSLSCSDCGQTAENKWLTLLRRSRGARLVASLHWRLQGHMWPRSQPGWKPHHLYRPDRIQSVFVMTETQKHFFFYSEII